MHEDCELRTPILKKYDAYGKQVELLDQMIQVETQAWNLDIENPNFELGHVIEQKINTRVWVFV